MITKNRPRYSIIIPVYNRPNEVDELLESLTQQTFSDFEVIIVEDGSKVRCDWVVDKYLSALDIKYHFKENSGQGFSRNFGFERARGDWFIVFDSDCLIPGNYFEVVDEYLESHSIGAYGGPDRAHDSFTAVQKAISYSMTSLFTTGGIRGNKKGIGVFHPRSFNMGITREVFEATKGYILPRKGEDIEFSIRIVENGFKTALIEKAYVYHKRRTNLNQFFRQLHFFGTARINVYRHYSSELKLIHFFPSIFILGLFSTLILSFFNTQLAIAFTSIYAFYFLLILIDSSAGTRSLYIGALAVVAAFVQLTAYGLGLLKEGIIYLFKG